MAGPFPGMDPYLENPVLWAGVHQGLITGLRNALNRLLPSGYIADMGERVYVMQPDRNIYPDVVIFEQPTPHPILPAGVSSSTAIADPPIVLVVEPVEIREVFIEILPVGEEKRVVTVIEVLSYINKARGSEGHDLYLTKQKELLHSDVNLIEIDLLRRGEHTVASPREYLLRKTHWDYLVCLHRSGQSGRYETWPRTIRDPLPRFKVPLDNGLPDIMLDLQEVFNHNYVDGAYGRRIDYRHDPPMPLEGEDTEWMDSLLRSKGLRA